VVARSAPPEDAGKAGPGDGDERDDANEQTTEATDPDAASASASDDAEPAEPPREEIKYKPPGVSKRRSATKGVPIVVNPVPPSERVPGGAGAAAAADAAAASDGAAEGAAAVGAGAAPSADVGAETRAGEAAPSAPAQNADSERLVEEMVAEAETAALQALSGSAAEPSAAAREAFKTAKDAFKAASAALDADAKTASGPNEASSSSSDPNEPGVGDGSSSGSIAGDDARDKDASLNLKSLRYIPADADVKLDDDGVPYVESDASLDELEPPGKWPSEKDLGAKEKEEAKDSKETRLTDDDDAIDADSERDAEETRSVDDAALLTAISAVVIAEKEAEVKAQQLQLSPPPLPREELPAIYAAAEGQGFASEQAPKVSKGMARGIRKPKVDPEKQGIPPSERVPAPKPDVAPEEKPEVPERDGDFPGETSEREKKSDKSDTADPADPSKRSDERTSESDEKTEKTETELKEEELAAKTKAKAAEMASWTTGVDGPGAKAKAPEPAKKEPAEAEAAATAAVTTTRRTTTTKWTPPIFPCRSARWRRRRGRRS
jgi:hypothetical protein